VRSDLHALCNIELSPCIGGAKMTEQNCRMRYLLTGGAGFIGSHLAEAILDVGIRSELLTIFRPGG
jgi:hypothetical protein